MKSKKNNDIEEMIHIVKVEPSKTPDYQGVLDRLKSIDLDYISKVLNPEQLENVSDYSIHDYPRLEMMGDIETLQKLIDSINKLGAVIKPIGSYKSAKEMFQELGFDLSIKNDETIKYDMIDFNNIYATITFDLKNKTFDAMYLDEPMEISLSLLKAVNQQWLELGWLDE